MAMSGIIDGDLGALAARFRAVQSAMVADVLDGKGYLAQTLPPNIRPLRPGMAVVGPAFTARGRAMPRGTDRSEGLNSSLEHLAQAQAHHVLVVEANDGDTYSSHVGEFHSTVMMSLGVAGTVTSGGARDAEPIAELGYPVFSGYQTPQDGLPRWRMEEFEIPIRIGNVAISPGDYVVADTDGVVIIPAALRDEVLTEAEAFAHGESEILKQVKQGVDIRVALRQAGGGPWRDN